MHAIVPLAGTPQVHPAPEAATFETPAGSVSITVTSSAASGPAFVTVSV